MASNIIPESIDAQYPVAGRDNDTQGFRDNFAVIKDNFTNAKTEIEQLQNTAVKLNAANNFQGTYIIDANHQAVTEKYFTLGTDVTTDVNISFLNGHYQTVFIGTEEDEINLILADFPLNDAGGGEDRLAKMSVELFTSANFVDPNRNIKVNFQIEGSGNLRTNSAWPVTFNIGSTANKDNPIIVEFWTYDGGANVYGNYLGKFD